MMCINVISFCDYVTETADSLSFTSVGILLLLCSVVIHSGVCMLCILMSHSVAVLPTKTGTIFDFAFRRPRAKVCVVCE